MTAKDRQFLKSEKRDLQKPLPDIPEGMFPSKGTIMAMDEKRKRLIEIIETTTDEKKQAEALDELKYGCFCY